MDNILQERITQQFIHMMHGAQDQVNSRKGWTPRKSAEKKWQGWKMDYELIGRKQHHPLPVVYAPLNVRCCVDEGDAWQPVCFTKEQICKVSLKTEYDVSGSDTWNVQLVSSLVALCQQPEQPRLW